MRGETEEEVEKVDLEKKEEAERERQLEAELMVRTIHNTKICTGLSSCI